MLANPAARRDQHFGSCVEGCWRSRHPAGGFWHSIPLTETPMVEQQQHVSVSTCHFRSSSLSRRNLPGDSASTKRLTHKARTTKNNQLSGAWSPSEVWWGLGGGGGAAEHVERTPGKCSSHMLFCFRSCALPLPMTFPPTSKTEQPGCSTCFWLCSVVPQFLPSPPPPVGGRPKHPRTIDAQVWVALSMFLIVAQSLPSPPPGWEQDLSTRKYA